MFFLKRIPLAPVIVWIVISSGVLRHATKIHTHPFFHANNCPSPPSLSCRSGLWSSRYTSARSHEWGEVYIWIHSALLMPRRPPANRRLITHLSTEWTLEWSTAPLLRYTDTQKFRCAYKQRQSWTHSSYKAIKVWLFYFALRILNQYSGILVYFVKCI